MTLLCFGGKIRRSCFHKHKRKEAADNEVMFANQRQVAYGVISCFYITGLERFLEGRDRWSRFTIRVPSAGFSGLALDLREHVENSRLRALMGGH